MSPCIMGLTTQDPYTAVSIKVVSYERGKAYATMWKVIMGNGAFTVV